MGKAVNQTCMGALGILAVASAMLFGTATSAQADDTVTITGNAYAFIFAGNVDRLEGAVIKVEEFPAIQAVAGPNGAYTLDVPDDSDITPYATFPGYYTVHDQTFHTRGKDLNQVNFQMPKQEIAEALAGVIGAEMTGEAGSKVIKNCAIVSTFFQKEGRSFLDFNDFHNFRPHGVIGATANAKTAAGTQPVDAIYFNSSVIPDRTQVASTRDGGVIWPEMPEGVYTVTAQHETKRFSQFQATCKPGWLVNANPPWGLYELARTEEPNPAVLPYVAPEPVPEPVDSILDANLSSAKVERKGARKRVLTLKVRSGESVAVKVDARQGKRRIKATRQLAAGNTAISLPVAAAYKPGALELSVKLTDTAGNSRSDKADLNVPAAKKARKSNRRK